MFLIVLDRVFLLKLPKTETLESIYQVYVPVPVHRDQTNFFKTKWRPIWRHPGWE